MMFPENRLNNNTRNVWICVSAPEDEEPGQALQSYFKQRLPNFVQRRLAPSFSVNL